MSNQLAVLPLFMTWQSLVPQISLESTNVDVGQMSPQLLMKLPRGYAVYPDYGVAYKFYWNGKGWDNSRKRCIGDGGYLALADTYEKVKIMRTWSRDVIGIWVGYHRLFNISEWVDVKTGSSPPTIPWNKSPSLENHSRKCGVIDASGDGTLAAECETYYNFVCEIPIQSEPKLSPK